VYYVVTYKNGATYNFGHNEPSATYPLVRNNTNFTAGFQNPNDLSNGCYSITAINTTNIESVVDTTKPQWSLNSTNSTLNGTSILHNLKWTDETALAGYIFSFDNGTGTLVNDSYVAMTGTTNWSNVSKIVNSTNNSAIRWSVCANDSSNNQNCSSIFTYRTLASVSSNSCTCPASNTNWVIAMTDYCNITSACNLGTGNLSFTGAGYCNISNTVTTNKLWNANLSNGATVYLYKSGGIINLV
jgi:hypothetical protein